MKKIKIKTQTSTQFPIIKNTLRLILCISFPELRNHTEYLLYETLYSFLSLYNFPAIQSPPTKTIKLRFRHMIEESWYILVIVNRRLFFNSVKMSSVYNVRFDVASVQYHKKLTWQIPGKNFPSSPTLLHCLFYHYSWGCLSAEPCTQKSTSVARNEMMKLATVQTYPYFSLMTWLIFLQNAQIWDCLPPFFHCGNS